MIISKVNKSHQESERQKRDDKEMIQKRDDTDKKEMILLVLLYFHGINEHYECEKEEKIK